MPPAYPPILHPTRIMTFLTVKRLRLYLGGLLILQLALFVRAVPYILEGSMDYRTFYTAGFMARTGAGPSLYLYDTEARLQSQLVTPSANANPLMHPAFTALLFAPLSFARYRLSCLLFFALNLLFLAFAAAILRPYLTPLATLWKPLPALLFFTFLPVGVALIQGQVSLLLLAVACASFAALQSGRDARAGLLLSLALIKFQIILPAALLFLLWRRWRFITGFSLGALTLAAISTALTGTKAQIAYLHTLFSMSSSLSAATQQARYANYPSRMPNLYGLAHAIFPAAHWTPAITLLASAALFLWAARQQASLPLALLVGLAVSYHLYLHDLSLLLLPISLVLAARAAELQHHNPRNHTDWRRNAALASSLLLLLAPLGRVLIATDLINLLAIPVLLLTLSLQSVGDAPLTNA